jgi:hypothetical protein
MKNGLGNLAARNADQTAESTEWFRAVQSYCRHARWPIRIRGPSARSQRFPVTLCSSSCPTD